MEAEALEFFEGLEADNSKPYWEAHKDDYQTFVRAPMEELLADLEPAWGESHVFRPYRDIRFSRDKTPYKTAIGARSAMGTCSSTCMAGCRMRHVVMASDQLDRYRGAVDEIGPGRSSSRSSRPRARRSSTCRVTAS